MIEEILDEIRDDLSSAIKVLEGEKE